MLLGVLKVRRHKILVLYRLLDIVLDVPPLLNHSRISLVPPRLLFRVVHWLGFPVVPQDLEGPVFLVALVEGRDGGLS